MEFTRNDLQMIRILIPVCSLSDAATAAVSALKEGPYPKRLPGGFGETDLPPVHLDTPNAPAGRSQLGRYSAVFKPRGQTTRSRLERSRGAAGGVRAAARNRGRFCGRKAKGGGGSWRLDATRPS